MEPLVLAKSANGVGRLTFNRPEQRNAMSPQMLELFHERLKELDGDREIRCIVIDGAGGNFVAGGEIHSGRGRPGWVNPGGRGRIQSPMRQRSTPPPPPASLTK